MANDTIHFADTHNGQSACDGYRRPVNLKTEPHTVDQSAVTCPDCLELIEAAVPALVCDACGQRAESTTARPDGSSQCITCWQSALAYGHDHVDHDGIVPDCPKCDRYYGHTVDQHGIISNPGKFEGEYKDSPYWWNQSLQGADDEYDGVALIKVTADDRAVWPELQAEIYGVIVVEDSQGFVRVRHVDQSEYTNTVSEYERNTAEQDGDQ